MSFAKQVAHSLPTLRRFSRMLLVSPDVADQFVAQCLEKLVTSPPNTETAHQNDGHHVTKAVFGSFLSVLKTETGLAPIPNTSNITPIDDPIERVLPGLAFNERQVFLLRHVEEFSAEDTAQMMNTSIEQVNQIEYEISRKLR